MRLGYGEILIVLVIALLVFGPSKLPQLGDALGKGIRNFKKGFEGNHSVDVTPEKTEHGQSATGSSGAPQTSAPTETKKA
jgi:sec-independent protein translocase protein TatA